MRKAAIILALALPLGLAPASAGERGGKAVQGFSVDPEVLCEIRDQWIDQLLAENPRGGWVPMKMEPTDQQLAMIGLPPANVLRSRSYEQPTIVAADGRTATISMAELQAAMRAQPVAAYAGTGCLGIRPGAWLLLLDQGVSWCSLAHVYGSPGSYDISTAGHCGKTGTTATVIAAFGNRGGIAGPVLLDFGKFAKSQDGGLGKDWALIDIYSSAQGLVSPTMCFWGGPKGMYTKTGDVAAFNWGGKGPSVSVTPDPLLAQGVAHYGHGLGVGLGGTPRAGAAIAWRSTHFMFTGAISPGDSGSGSNAVVGDMTSGGPMEAAGINTHLWIDPIMRSGIGIMGGTRATQVTGTLANGQLIPYPAPCAGCPG
ncbi:MAG TPA: hypothetical protein VM638_00475 [Actinomycetota bacterium]|nr:hypothetical protein [Actinomycetota bacterium]